MTDNELQEIRAAILKRAAEQYENEGTLEIDDNPIISMTDRGAYVQAWVWVEDVDVDLPQKFYNAEEDVWDWPTECANPDK